MFFETTLYTPRYKIVVCETERKLPLSRNFLNFKYLKIATKSASSIVIARKSLIFSYERRQRIKHHESRKCENARYKSRCTYTIFVLTEQLLRIWRSRSKKAGFHRCCAGKCGKYWRTVKWRVLKARKPKIISGYMDVNERSNGVHASKSVFREVYKIFRGAS